MSTPDINQDKKRVASYPSNTPSEYEIGTRLRRDEARILSRAGRMSCLLVVSFLWRGRYYFVIHDPYTEDAPTTRTCGERPNVLPS